MAKVLICIIRIAKVFIRKSVNMYHKMQQRLLASHDRWFASNVTAFSVNYTTQHINQKSNYVQRSANMCFTKCEPTSL